MKITHKILRRVAKTFRQVAEGLLWCADRVIDHVRRREENDA